MIRIKTDRRTKDGRVNLKITAEMYYKIREHNSSLIKFVKGDGAYIMGMKVVF